jgi:hypothetical protein
MKSLANNLLISIGISIIIGISLGYINRTQKYYFLDPGGPKREISEETYLDSDFNPSSVIEKEFNTRQAILFGTLSFGVCVIIIGITNKRRLNNLPRN